MAVARPNGTTAHKATATMRSVDTMIGSTPPARPLRIGADVRKFHDTCAAPGKSRDQPAANTFTRAGHYAHQFGQLDCHNVTGF